MLKKERIKKKLISGSLVLSIVVSANLPLYAESSGLSETPVMEEGYSGGEPGNYEYEGAGPPIEAPDPENIQDPGTMPAPTPVPADGATPVIGPVLPKEVVVPTNQGIKKPVNNPGVVSRSNNSDSWSYSGDLPENHQSAEGKETIRTFQYAISSKSGNQDYGILRFVDTGIVAMSEDSLFLKANEVKEFVSFLESRNKALTESFNIDLSKDYTKDEFEMIFEKSRLVVRIQNTRVSKKFGMTEYMELRKGVNFEVYGKAHEYTIDPMVANSVVMMPIRDVAEAMGATVVWSNEDRTATVTLGEKTLVYTADSAGVKGQDEALAGPVLLKNDRAFAPVGDMVTELGGEMHWDAQSLRMVIEKANI